MWRPCNVQAGTLKIKYTPGSQQRREILEPHFIYELIAHPLWAVYWLERQSIWVSAVGGKLYFFCRLFYNLNINTM